MTKSKLKLDIDLASAYRHSDNEFNGVPLSVLNCVNIVEIESIDLLSASKSCELDPLPT